MVINYFCANELYSCNMTKNTDTNNEKQKVTSSDLSEHLEKQKSTLRKLLLELKKEERKRNWKNYNQHNK